MAYPNSALYIDFVLTLPVMRSAPGYARTTSVAIPCLLAWLGASARALAWLRAADPRSRPGSVQ